LIRTFFLRAKNWQIFLLVFIIPTSAEAIGVLSAIAKIPSPNDFREREFLSGLFAIGISIVLLWLWSLGSFLVQIIQPQQGLNRGLLAFAVSYPATYILIGIPIILHPSVWSFAVIFPFHVLAFGCVIYALYFVSRTLAVAESGRPATLSDFGVPFCLLWLYPVGIWIIQPRINRLFANTRRADLFPATTKI